MAVRARRSAIDRQGLLEAERSRLAISPHGRLRLAVGYPSTYHVAQSSLAFQWVTEMASLLPDVGVERFYADPDLADGCARTFEQQRPLAHLDVLAWSCSFEPDAVNILHTLSVAGIPLRREQRRSSDPLLVLGGPLALINPLPLAPVIDVFCLGPAETLLPQLVACIVSCCDRPELLETLAERDGFFVPALHLDHRGRPLQRLRRVRRQAPGGAGTAGAVPASHVVTPFTEYPNRALIEISEGCPERCRFCWIGHTAGRFRSHPAAAVLGRIEELSALTDRIGLVATAVGDYPELARVLAFCQDHGLQASVSSLRIPAMQPEVLQLLAATGARSVTIAPEAGNETLRARLGKRISDEQILHAVETAQRNGLEGLKLYFLLGLPGETAADISSIAELVRRVRGIMDRWGRDRGRLANLHVGVNLLVPKPYTPLHRETMIALGEAKQRFQHLRKELRGLANLRLDAPAPRDAQWQAFLARAGVEAFPLLEAAASGTALSQLLAHHRDTIDGVIRERRHSPVPWHFISGPPPVPAGADGTLL